MLSVLAGRPSHEAHFGRFTALATELAGRWEQRAADGPIALQKDLSALSLRMICEFALGGGVESAGRVVSAFEDVLTAYLAQQYTPGAADDPAAESLAYLRSTVDRVLAARGERGDERRERSDLIGALLGAGESPVRIRDSVLMTMLAAHHTTGVAISWTLYLLAQHPAVAARVAAEVDRVLGERAAPEYADLKELTYLDAVLKETMRLYPPGPYGAREATEDVALGRYTVPAGTVIFYPFWAVHMNPEYWPDPEVFDPGRFAPERSGGRPRLAYIPFGLGPRSCEGAALATVEAQLVLAVMLKRFEFTSAPGSTVTPIERFVLWAEEDINMILTPRRT
jgi:cytochrome P450